MKTFFIFSLMQMALHADPMITRVPYNAAPYTGETKTKVIASQKNTNSLVSTENGKSQSQQALP